MKKALITGAAGGIGREMTLGLLGQGWTVLGCDISEDRLSDLSSEALRRRLSGEFLPLSCDLNSAAAVDHLLSDLKKNDGVNALINNAGVFHNTGDRDRPAVSFWEMETKRWHEFMWLNATVPFLLASQLVPYMMDRRWGRIVNVTTSLASMLKELPYGPSKASSEAQIGCFSKQLQGTGVTANVLVPGGVTNTMMAPDFQGWDRTAMLQPDVMVPPLLWLMSDASNGVSGRRFIAASWTEGLSDAGNVAASSHPVGWEPAPFAAIIPPRVSS